jgi:hypothetical protein
VIFGTKISLNLAVFLDPFWFLEVIGV